jgi:hypothetical protein
MSSLYQNSSIGFLADIPEPAKNFRPAHLYDGPIGGMYFQMPKVEAPRAEYVPQPMDQFEVREHGGKRYLSVRDPRKDMALYHDVKEL